MYLITAFYGITVPKCVLLWFVLFCCSLKNSNTSEVFSKERNYYEQFRDTSDYLNISFEHPSLEEAQLGLTFPAPSFWGNRIRERKSVRIVLFGGSNTANRPDWTYANRLKHTITARAAAGKLDATSYVENEGYSGHTPLAMIHKRFAFQDKYPKDLWPNIVSLEFSVNNGFPTRMDQLIHVMNHLYSSRGLKKPSFMILDFFYSGQFYENGEHYKPTQSAYPGDGYFSLPFVSIDDEVKKFRPPVDDKQQYINSKGFNRGNRIGDQIASVARFYGIPMLSLVDATFPAFTRYFINSVSSPGSENHWNQRFPFSLDGVHMSSLGCSFFVNEVLLPFLDAELAKPSSSDVDRDWIFDYDIRMFPAQVYATPGTIATYSSWGSGDNHLESIVMRTDGWEFVSTRHHEDDHGHICYGSNTQASDDTPARFMLSYSASTCKPTSTCGLEIGYVHSWDASYIGDTVCNVFPNLLDQHRSTYIANYNNPLLPDGGYRISGNTVHGVPVTDTTVHIHHLTQKLVNGTYLLECRKENNVQLANSSAKGRLSCFAEVNLLSPVEAN